MALNLRRLFRTLDWFISKFSSSIPTSLGEDAEESAVNDPHRASEIPECGWMDF